MPAMGDDAHGRAGGGAGAPKEGRRRMHARPKKLDAKKWSALWRRTPLARHGTSHRGQVSMAKWPCSAEQLQSFSEKQIAAKMTAAGFLKDWSLH
eukprot:3204518-Pyramimonas_sp.AAC.1